MTIDRRMEEAVGLLSRPGGPGAEELRRARALVRQWLHDADLDDAVGTEPDGEEGSTAWEDVAPTEVLNRRRRGSRPVGA